MKKKCKFGFNTGNRVLKSLNGVNQRRINKDEWTVIKTFRHKIVQPHNADELNNRIVEAADILIQDGNINGGIDEKYHRQHLYRWYRYNTVSYSMNKRKRWLLPQRIKHCVEQMREDKMAGTEDELNISQNPSYHISLLEREIQHGSCYRLKHIWGTRGYQNDSIAYSSTLPDSAHVVPKKSLSSETDLKIRASKKTHIGQKQVAKEKRQKGHNQHFRDLQRDERMHGQPPETDNTDATQLPEIHYEVCHPWHGPSLSYFKCKDHKMLKSVKKCKHYRNKLWHHDNLTSSSLMQLAEDNWNYESQYTFEDLNCDFDNTATGHSVKPCTDVPLVSVLKSLKHRNKRKNQKPERTLSHVSNQACSKPVKCYGKNAVVYEGERPESQKDVIKSPSVTPDVLRTDNINTDASDPVEVCAKVLCSSVCQKSLESHFGDAYLEGFSFPRRFTINLSQYFTAKVPDHVKTAKDDQLVIVCTVSEENNNTLHDTVDQDTTAVCAVNLAFHGNPADGKLLNMHEHLFSCVDQNHLPGNLISLIDSLAHCLQRKSGDDFSVTTQTRLKDSLKTDTCKYSYFCELNKWKMEYYTLSEAFDIVNKLPLVRHHKKYNKLGSNSVAGDSTSTNDDSHITCDICLKEIQFQTFSHHKSCATALSACKHWFCDECWKQHLIYCIRNGAVSLECPSFECREVVDFGTLISLVGHKYYNKHWYHLQHSKIEQRAEWQWCPQTSCGGVVRGSFKAADESLSRACVQCTCGYVWCFDCQGEPHWPVSCEISQKYVKLVKQKEEDTGKIFFVDVKKCPKCKHPIEKNGGCQHMICRCGFSFCWECLAPWSDHRPTLTCPKQRTKVTTVKLDDVSNLTLKEGYFKKALQFRKSRKKLNHCSAKVKGRIVHVLMRLSRKEKRSKHSQTVTNQPLFFQSLDFLMKKAGFLLEVYHILEFSCAWISQATRKSLCNIMSQVELLALCVEQFSKSLFVDQPSSNEEWMMTLNDGEEKLKPLMRSVIRHLNRADH